MLSHMRLIVSILSIFLFTIDSLAQGQQSLEQRVSALEQEITALKERIKVQSTTNISNNRASMASSEKRNIIVQDGIKAEVTFASCFLKNSSIPDDYIVSVTIVLENQTDNDIPFIFLTPDAVDNFGNTTPLINYGETPDMLYPGVPIKLNYYGECPHRASSFAIINLSPKSRKNKYNLSPIRFTNIPIKWE